jgi:class 3 adenylate cyclase
MKKTIFTLLFCLFLTYLHAQSAQNLPESWAIKKDSALSKGDKKKAAEIVFRQAWAEKDKIEMHERWLFHLNSAETWAEESAQIALNAQINYLIAFMELNLNRIEDAEKAAEKADKNFDAAQDKTGIADALSLKAKIFEQKNAPEKALREYIKLFEFARKQENFNLQKKTAEKIAELYAASGKRESEALFKFYADNLQNPMQNRMYYDSAFIAALVRENEQIEEKYHLRISLISIVFFLLLTMIFWIFGKNMRAANLKLARKNHTIKLQQQKAEELVGGILPHSVALELKEKGCAAPLFYESVSILFADLKGFTFYAEKVAPEKMIADLNHCFSAFDNIIAKHGLEKIKTIGDAYMCAGGVPVPNDTHAFDITAAALEMQKFMNEWKKERTEKNEEAFELKIGINTGAVVAGVIGTSKFAYDIWGDAVNLAARVESVCNPGFVNISESTYKIVGEKYECLHRGKVSAKNKGETDMYYVIGEKLTSQ